MSFAENSSAVFDALKHILLPYAVDLVQVSDQPDNYYLDTAHIMKNGKPLFFGSVQLKKRYVSFYLMPVYVFPDLLEGMSAELTKRMQGKSCFNFTACNDALFEELDQLTKAGHQRYKSAGYLN